MWRSGTVLRFSDGGAFEKSSRRRGRLPPMPRRCVLLLVRRIRVVAKPAATALFVTEPAAAALRLRPLLVSAEIKKLSRGRSGHAQHQSHRDGQRNQPTTLGEGAIPVWFLRHAPGPHIRRTCLSRLAQSPCGAPQFTVKCVIVSADHARSSPIGGRSRKCRTRRGIVHPAETKAPLLHDGVALTPAPPGRLLRGLTASCPSKSHKKTCAGLPAPGKHRGQT